MKKLLITGASGFLGSRIAVYYKNKYEVFTPSHKELDITNRDSVFEKLQSINPDYIIHCAAVSDVAFCEKEPEKAWSINVDGSRNVAEAAKCIGATCILCSSDQVYFGSVLNEAHAEEEVLEPFNLYGKGKLAAEQECLEVNPNSILLRLSWMYDTNSTNEQEHGDFVRTLLQKIEEREVLSYPIHDMRGITYVGDVVQKLELAFALPGGVYNFGAPNDKSTYEMMIEVAEKLDWDIGKIERNEIAFLDNPRNITMSQKKINEHKIFFKTSAEGLIEQLAAWKQ